MPQITLQYTDNVQQREAFSELFAQIHLIVSEVGGIRVGNCKSRAIRLEDYFVAAGDAQRGFVHLDLAILEGRTVEVKRELGQRCLDTLKRNYEPVNKALDLQITVEIRDMRRDAYFKSPEGTLTPP
jgi:5-carboxymethyl-2-hydroxymuconate isomerase